MSRSLQFRCRNCDALSPQWTGRCGACGEWNALEQCAAPAPPTSAGAAAEAVALSAVDPTACRPWPTGLAEVDRVLAGGLTPGSVTLVFGEPGVGKSTLLLQAAAGVAHTGEPVLLVSAEESAPQVRGRADRLGALPEQLLVLATAEVDAAERAAEVLRPRLMVIDSIQTMVDRQAPGSPGTVNQVRGCADRLASMARRLGIAVVLVGHVTKDGDLAGPRTLEHLVDTVLSFEGDRHHTLRVLRAVKHRFGPTGEVGLFEMGDGGLTDVAEPGRLLLGDRRAEVPGSAVTALLEGRRPLLVEVQSLTCAAPPGAVPRRNTQGLDGRRLAVLLAVLECRAGTSLAGVEVFTSVAGGIRAAEPATDLPVLLAVASAVAGRALPADLVSFGEVGLAGEVRQVVGPERRLAEAARLGFKRALVPAATTSGPAGISLVRVGSVAEALAAVGSRPRGAPGGGGRRADNSAAARPIVGTGAPSRR